MESNNEDKLKYLPLVLGILGVFLGLVEGLNCPVLFGWENIITEMVISVVGGLAAVILYWKTDETLVSGIQFMVTGILMFALIQNMATYGLILFVLTGLITIFLGGNFSVSDKRLIGIPAGTFILLIIILLIAGFASSMYEDNLSNEISISNLNAQCEDSFGYYNSNVTYDLNVNTSMDYIQANVIYYDQDGKIISTDTPWSQYNINPGVYKIKSTYFDTFKPVKAEISLKNDYDSNESFYTQNVTFTQTQASI